MDKMEKQAIITVLGRDRVGIIAAVSAELAKGDVNILDINQTVMQGGVFTMSLLADCASMNCGFNEFKQAIDGVADFLKMDIRVMREEIFTSMHRI